MVHRTLRPALGSLRYGRGPASGVLNSAPQLAVSLTMTSRTLTAILKGGLIAASVDIIAACLVNQRSVPFILHTVAGGLIGDRSFAGGAPAAFLGLLLQEAMGIIIAAIYVLAAERWPTLRQRWIAWGVAYGAVIFLVMNYVVLPL